MSSLFFLVQLYLMLSLVNSLQHKQLDFQQHQIIKIYQPQQYIFEFHPQIQGSIIVFNKILLNGAILFSDFSLNIGITLNRCLKTQRQQCQDEFKYLKQHKMVRLRQEITIDYCGQCLILMRIKVSKTVNVEFKQGAQLQKLLLLIKWERKNSVIFDKIRQYQPNGQLSWLQQGSSIYQCTKLQVLRLCMMYGLIQILNSNNTLINNVKVGDYCKQLKCGQSGRYVFRDKNKPYSSKYFLHSYTENSYSGQTLPIPSGFYQRQKGKENFSIHCSTACFLTIAIIQPSSQFSIKILQPSQQLRYFDVNNTKLQFKHNASISFYLYGLYNIYLKNIQNFQILAHSNEIPYVQQHKKYSTIITNTNPLYGILEIPPYGQYIRIQFQLCIQCQISFEYCFTCPQIFTKQQFKHQERVYLDITKIQLTSESNVHLIKNNFYNETLFMRIKSKNYAIFNFKVEVFKNLSSIPQTRIKNVNKLSLLEHNQTHFILNWHRINGSNFHYKLIFAEDKQLVYKYINCPNNYFHNFQLNLKIHMINLNTNTSIDEEKEQTFVECNQFFRSKTIFLSILAYNQFNQYENYQILMIQLCKNYEHIGKISIVLISTIVIGCLVIMLCILKWVFTTPEKIKTN